jgi:hypothetical protein
MAERITRQWLEKRADLATRLLRDSETLTGAEALVVGDTGGTKYAYRLDLTAREGGYGGVIVHAANAQGLDGALEALVNLSAVLNYRK